MHLGIIGLGKMGSSLALQAREKGIEVTGFSEALHEAEALRAAGVKIASSVQQLVQDLAPPRTVLLLVPAGPTVDEVIAALAPLLSQDDLIVDCGNSYYGDSIEREERLFERGIGFIDCGTSGGPSGARHGACFMAGGEARWIARIEPTFRSLAVPDGFLHAGPPGAGHFVKLIHNAIEFGMLQAIGEGVALLRASELSLDLKAIFHNWNHGSVIRGWLVELMEKGLAENPDLERVSSHVEDTGEVNWIVEDALSWEVPIPVIAAAVQQLFESRDPRRLASRSVAVLRRQFGDHPLGENAAIRQERRVGRVGGRCGFAARSVAITKKARAS